MTVNPLVYLRLPNWLGDVCMSLPVLEALLARNYQVIVCARPWAKTLLSGYALHDFIPMTGQWWSDAKAIKQHQKTRLSDSIQKVGLSLPDSLSSALVFKFGGIPAAGYRDDGRSWLLKWPIDKPTHSLHAVESWYFLAYSASKIWQFPIAPQPLASLHLAGVPEADPKKFGLDSDKKNILIAPTAVGLHKGQIKVWPHYEALTQALIKEGYDVYMCPPPNEVAEAEKNAPSATRLDSLPLLAFAQLCKSVDLVICNDSGVSHMAAAVDAKQITLIGVTDITHTGPWSDQADCLGQNGQWASLDTVLERIHERC